VGAEAFQLIADRHDAHGLAGARGASHHFVDPLGGSRGFCGLGCAAEEPLAELCPGFALHVFDGGKAVGGGAGKRGLDSGDPVERNLLPEVDVPQLLVDGVRRAGGLAVDQFLRQSLEDVRWRGGVAFAHQDLFELIHVTSDTASDWYAARDWMWCRSYPRAGLSQVSNKDGEWLISRCIPTAGNPPMRTQRSNRSTTAY